MPSARTVVLNHVCPALGVLLGNSMWLAPLRAVGDAVDRGRLGSLNPAPWVAMAGNCIGWVLYSYLTEDLYVLAGNLPGVVLGLHFNLCAAKLLYAGHRREGEARARGKVGWEGDGGRGRGRGRKDVPSGMAAEEGTEEDGKGGGGGSGGGGRGDGDGNLDYGDGNLDGNDSAFFVFRSPARHEAAFLSVCGFWAVAGSVVAFLAGAGGVDRTRVLIPLAGALANANLAAFYAAPLSTAAGVIRTGSARSLHAPTATASMLNGTFWSSYGWAVGDLYIAIPNLLGAVLGAAQLALVWIYRGGEEVEDEMGEVRAAPPAAARSGELERE